MHTTTSIMTDFNRNFNRIFGNAESRTSIQRLRMSLVEIKISEAKSEGMDIIDEFEINNDQECLDAFKRRDWSAFEIALDRVIRNVIEKVVKEMTDDQVREWF